MINLQNVTYLESLESKLHPLYYLIISLVVQQTIIHVVKISKNKYFRIKKSTGYFNIHIYTELEIRESINDILLPTS